MNLLFIIYTFGHNNVYSQCIADAGKDTVLCLDLYNSDSVLVGGSPTATGAAPFTYEWTAHETYLSYNFYASDFLNDTTSSNPYLFIDQGLEEVDLYLKVIDQLGFECFDTLKIQFSSITQSFGDKLAYIELGDSVKLYPGISGGIEPVTYSWSPTTALSNPNIINPYASPSVDIGYVATLTDSAGCEFTDLDIFEVYVDVSDLTNFKNSDFKAYFDYTQNQIKIKNTKKEVFKYSIFNSLGELISEGETLNSDVECRNFTSGLYYFIAFTNNSTHQFNLKFIIN